MNIEVYFAVYSKHEGFKEDTLGYESKELVEHLVNLFKENTLEEGVQPVLFEGNTYLVEVRDDEIYVLGLL